MQRQRDNNLALKNMVKQTEEEILKRDRLIEQLESEEDEIENELQERLKIEIE